MRINAFQTRTGAGPAAVVGDEVKRLHSGKVPNSEFRIPNSIRVNAQTVLRSWGARLLGLVAGAGLAWAQGTAFSYQGQLTDGATAANGTYDLTFSLWNAATAGAQQGATLSQTAVGVANGLFTATLDFGAQFPGAGRWLEIAVRTNGAAAFTTLAERQPVLPTPYAIHAGSASTATTATTVTGNVPASQLTGTLSATQIPNLDASKITSGTFTGNGAGLTDVFVGSLVQLDPVIAWGFATSDRLKPPTDLTNVVALSGAGMYVLALKSGGSVVGWGDNSFGTAVPPAGLTNVIKISAGEMHSLALRSDGTVVAWGNSSGGRTSVPAGLAGVSAVVAGGEFSLALKSDGRVVGWGGTNVFFSPKGVVVPSDLAGVIAIAAGASHWLALEADGSVAEWKINGTPRNIPNGLTNVVAIAAGAYHSLALKSDGTVVAWGDVSSGQTDVPAGLTDVVSIAGGMWHSLALKSDGTVVGWGETGYPQVGFGGQATVPAGMPKIAAIAAAGLSSFALRADPVVPAKLALLDRSNFFEGTVSATGFSGNGSGLTNLNASALTKGTVPSARIPNLDAGKITAGTLADARLSGNVARIDGSPSFAPAAETRAASFTGSRSGSQEHAVVHVENTSASGWASPALRVLGRGSAAEGALSVSAEAGLIARFGNAAAWVAQLDDLGGFSATSFSGNGSSLTSLNASALETGMVADARLSANVALGNGSPTFTSSVRLADTNLFLRGGTDTNHGLAWFGGSQSFGGTTVDGPVLYGYSGGALGSTMTAAKVALRWDAHADVSLGGDLTITNSLSVTSPAGTQAASFTGSRTGLPSSAVVQIENTETGISASPVLRLVGRGSAGDGALSVAAEAGRIARFGNKTDWVAVLDNAGNFSATSFSGDGSGLTSLNASALTTGTLPAAQIPDLSASKITAGTVSDARLSANVALLNGSPAFTAAAGSRVASFTGSRTGLPSSAVVQIENTETGTSASPVLRLVGRGSAGDGALSVAAEAGRIARFGNKTDWVAVLDNAGNFTATSFLGDGSALTGLNASALTAGTVPVARIPTLNASQIPNLDASKITSGTFTGNGSGLVSLNASALSSGTVPVAQIPNLDAGKITAGIFATAQIPNLDAGKITTGTVADARLSANVARLDGSPVFTSDVRLGDHDLHLRGGTDSNHGLGWFGGSGRTFAGATVDGPVLYGFLGGALGSTKTAQRIALSWNDSSDVTLGGDLTITNTLSVTSPGGIRAASFTGSRTGNFNSAVVQVENTSTSGTASPALRVLGRGSSIDGALNVSADTGRIARFGNATDWVAAMDNAGNFAATSFVTLSDRNKKAGFTPVDVEAVLAKLASLPLTTWHYTNDAAATPHLGPMAQDFHAAFGLGGDDKTIATVDADGVALAAIQGLHRKTEVLVAENAAIREELTAQRSANAELRDELGEVRALVLQLQQQLNANRP